MIVILITVIIVGGPVCPALAMVAMFDVSEHVLLSDERAESESMRSNSPAALCFPAMAKAALPVRS